MGKSRSKRLLLLTLNITELKILIAINEKFTCCQDLE